MITARSGDTTITRNISFFKPIAAPSSSSDSVVYDDDTRPIHPSELSVEADVNSDNTSSVNAPEQVGVPQPVAVPITRTRRERRAPSHLKDYVCYK